MTQYHHAAAFLTKIDTRRAKPGEVNTESVIITTIALQLGSASLGPSYFFCGLDKVSNGNAIRCEPGLKCVVGMKTISPSIGEEWSSLWRASTRSYGLSLSDPLSTVILLGCNVVLSLLSDGPLCVLKHSYLVYQGRVGNHAHLPIILSERPRRRVNFTFTIGPYAAIWRCVQGPFLLKARYPRCSG